MTFYTTVDKRHDKPCPFCGWNEQVYQRYEIPYSVVSKEKPEIYYQVECNDCGCTLPGFRSLDEAINGWNKRPIIPPEVE